jgi:homoserine kinase
MKKEVIKIFTPATIANVSCGFDVLGIALDNPLDEIIIKKYNYPGINIKTNYGSIVPLETKKNVIGIVLNRMMNKTHEDIDIKGLEIEICKNIQPGSGIGSSSASAAGAAVGANILLKNNLSLIELIKISMEGEKLVSGTVHADNVAPPIMGGITLIRSYNPLDIIPINIPIDFWISIIHPNIEIKTIDSRNIIKKNISINNAIKQWGNLSCLIAGVYQENYNLISRSLEDVIIEPIRYILIPFFYDMKNECINYGGAIGGGISGSGPSIFVISNGEKNSKYVAKSMDKIYKNVGIYYKIYISRINKKGIKCNFV